MVMVGSGKDEERDRIHKENYLYFVNNLIEKETLMTLPISEKNVRFRCLLGCKVLSLEASMMREKLREVQANLEKVKNTQSLVEFNLCHNVEKSRLLQNVVRKTKESNISNKNGKRVTGTQDSIRKTHNVQQIIQAMKIKTKIEKEAETKTKTEEETKTTTTTLTKVQVEPIEKVKTEKMTSIFNPSIKEIAKIVRKDRNRFIQYINDIVRDYLTACGKNVMSHHEFNGDFQSLHSYVEALVQEGIGTLVESEIRINRKNRNQAFITMNNDPSSMDPDGMIPFLLARCFAFEGDIAKAFVVNLPSANDSVSAVSQAVETTEGSEERTTIFIRCKRAFVLDIVNTVHDRIVFGRLNISKITNKDGKTIYSLHPLDSRIPEIFVDALKCRDFFKDNSIVVENILSELYCEVQVNEIDEHGNLYAYVTKFVGVDGILKDDLRAVLRANQIEIKPFDSTYEVDYGPNIFMEEDLKDRTDLRKKCIFTIDPLTAKDLDDAVSLERLGGGLYELGVHISDVTHYLKEDSDLDNIVKERATSIYLPTEVIEMLPKSLTNICSLLPGKDKLTISVFQKIFISGKKKGEPRIVRSVINSCCKLAYEHAQYIIDNPNVAEQKEDFPEIHRYTYANVRQRILLLNNLAINLKKRRYNNGALNIHNTKLCFQMDETGYPISYSVETRAEANFLIEEFMLLANQITAKFIYDKYPSTSILRRHAEPLGKPLANLYTKLKNFGLTLNTTTSQTLQYSLEMNCIMSSSPDAMHTFLNTAFTKTMARAKYFCTHNVLEKDLKHYALCVPFYTHFTSPIRRYADILVHRNVTAALGLTEPTKRSIDELNGMANICNTQHYRAHCASDEALDVCFRHFVERQGYLVRTATVCDMRMESMDVIVTETGHELTIRFKEQGFQICLANIPQLLLLKKNDKVMQIKQFSNVYIMIYVNNNKKLAGILLLPEIPNPVVQIKTPIFDYIEN